MKHTLTERELNVLKYLVRGMRNEEISDKLNISVHTTKAHLEAIYQKLEVTNRNELIKKITQNWEKETIVCEKVWKVQIRMQSFFCCAEMLGEPVKRTK